MPKTETKTEISHNLIEQLSHLAGAVETLSEQLSKANPRPVAGQPKGDTITLPMELRRQLAIKAQFFGMSGPEELVQMVLHAFLEMAEEETVIQFPLCLQSVPTP